MSTLNDLIFLSEEQVELTRINPYTFADQLIEALKEEIGKEYEQGFIRTAIDLAYSKLKEDKQ